METRQMTPFFPSTFSTTVTFVFVFENSPNSFSRGRPFGPFWSIKYLNFGQKLPIRTTHHTFSESKHAEVTKNQYYALSPVGSQKKRYQLMDYYQAATKLQNILRNILASNVYLLIT